MKTSVITRHYHPRGSALDVFKHKQREVLLAGPAGTGKSRACLEKIHAMCLMTPGVRALMVRKTLESLRASAMVTFREHVAREAIQVGDVRYYSGGSDKPPGYMYANGSVLLATGMDGNNSNKVMSTEFDVIYVQEAVDLTLDDWEKLLSRLRNNRISFQQIIADCNPAQPTHWLKLRADQGVTTMLFSRHEDNPVLFNSDGTMTSFGADYIRGLDSMTGVRKERLRHGRWVAAEGIVYDTYDEGTNLIPQFEIPEDWKRWWSVDFGFTNPFVLQCWAIDPDGRAYMYREIYKTQTLVEDHAKMILDIVAPGGVWKEPKPSGIVCDHDGEGRATFERYLGMSTQKAKKDVQDGIQAVATRWQKAGDGRARLYLCRDALAHPKDNDLLSAGKPTCTAEELPGYVWDAKQGKQPKEEPVKENDHGMDALRYFVAEQDLKGGLEIRSLW